VPATSRTSSTGFALLGLLSLGPASGYDLKRRAEQSVGHFWSESYGQIYPSLKRLQKDGLVTCDVVRSRGAGKPTRMVYSITAQGRTVLDQWLVLPPRSEPFRSELLLKLFFGTEATHDSNAAHLRRIRGQETSRLEQYRTIEQELTSRYPDAPELLWWLCTLSYGRHRSQAIIQWADETLNRLQAVPRPRRKKRAS
jgi:PadR family transcriptional regulator AphA